MGDGIEIGKDVFTANEPFFSCFLTLVALTEYPCPCRKNSMAVVKKLVLYSLEHTFSNLIFTLTGEKTKID